MDRENAEASFEDALLRTTTLPRMVEASADRYASQTAQRYKGGVYDRSLVAADALPAAPDGSFAALTYAETNEIVRSLAAGFRELGLDAGDAVGVFSDTRLEWAQADFSLLAAGGVVTTVYPSSSEQQVLRVLGDADAQGVVVENAALLSRVFAVEDDLELDFIVVMDEISEDSDVAAAVGDRNDVRTLGELFRIGRRVFDAAEYESWLDARSPADLASIIYTSGTTGVPKGVELTHRNFRTNVNQCYRRFGPRSGGDFHAIGTETTMLSFLPLAHVFERLVGHFLMFGAGATVAYAESTDTLSEDFRLVAPTMGTGVPRVYERLYDAAREKAAASPFGVRIFDWAMDVARRHAETSTPGALLSAQHALADRLVFSTVRAALGGHFDYLISGGGSLSADLCARFHGMGLPVIEGYGLTETSPVVSANPPDDAEIGTIGPPLHGVDVRIDADAVSSKFSRIGRGAEGAQSAPTESDVGELLVSGPNVFEGYHGLPEETAEAFTDDGWFRTGDVVERRPDGHLVFRARSKELLALSTGKLVPPEPIEAALARERFVEEGLVLGDGRRYVSALIAPDVDAVRAWADADGIALPDDDGELREVERVRDCIEEQVDDVNAGLERHEKIKRFRLIPEPFTDDDELVTPTMKPKRRDILDRYAADVDGLYAEKEV